MSSVNIYLCSNPRDSVQERRELRETVFPKLRDHCRRKHGVDFRVIDPYEGLNPLDWPSKQSRQHLLQRCRDTSVGPFFVALIGEEYGTASLPEKVEISEFQNILQACQSMQLNTGLLEGCYRRDENIIPPCFCLLSQHSSQTAAITEDKTWADSLQEVTDVLHTSVKQCILDGSITAEKAQKYFRSGLESDLRFAMENCSSSDMKNCICYIHKISNQRKTGDRQEDQDSSDRLSVIRDHFLPDLVTSSHLEVYTTTTQCDRQQGYTLDLRQTYIDGLCQQLFTDLSRLIDSAVTKKTAPTHCTDTMSQQADLCHIYSQLYRIEHVAAQKVKAYLEQQNPKYPLVLIGGPCSGKTVLMAHCASQVKLWLKSVDPVVITHFAPLPLKQHLNNICHDMAVSYNQPWDNCMQGVTQLKEAFNELLAVASSSKYPLILMVDGLDQTPCSEGPQHMTWLPEALPLNVKVVISTSYTKSGTLTYLKKHYPNSNFFLELEPFQRSSCSQMLTDLLKSSKRKITSGQQMYVNEALKQCPLPLYAELLFRQVSLWNSETEVTEESLRQGIHNNINWFLQHLEKKHGQALVSRSMSFLTLSRYGLTEAELTDILSCEDDLVSMFLPIEDPPYKLRFPEVVVERLLLDLEGFLVGRQISGSRVLFWVSRHFRLVTLKRYVDSIDTSDEIHLQLANYFSGRWAYGRAKPLEIASRPNMESNKQDTTEAKPMKMYIDRNPYGQPWLWKTSKPSIAFQDSCFETGGVNFRKVLELPYHLKLSRRLDELCQDVMLSFGFHHAMLMGGLVQELISWLKEISQFMLSRELWLLVCILKGSLSLLQNFPADIPLIIEAQLFPFLGGFPELEDFAKQLCVRNVRSGITMVLSPSSHVPCSTWELSVKIKSSVTDVAIADNGIAVLLLSDGSVWAWNGITSEQFGLPHVPTITYASLKMSNGYLLLSSSCNRLFLCDMHTMIFEEVPVLNTEINQNHISPEGFLVTATKMFWWYRGEHHVCMYSIDDKSPNSDITLLHCPGFVTCVSCPFDQHFIFCGQNNGNVSVFDMQSHKLISTLSGSTESPLIGLKPVVEEVMACIDSVGRLFIWNIQNIFSPSLTTEYLSNEDTEVVLNIDFTVDNEALLICKRQKILLWDTKSCTVDDQFLAPQGKAFVQAMLDHDSQFLLAILEGCTSVLVWDLCTGKCVLSLNTGSAEAPKLLKVGDQHLSAVMVNGITTWDIDVVRVAAALPKTGSKATKVALVKSREDQCYTNDGTELVWKWDTQSGKVEGCFLHHSQVTDFAVSQDGEHLVTVASGDIYVWRIVDGVNLYRISGSAASQVLITPRGQTAVSLSDKGLSRVWKLANGHEVCSFLLKVEKPIISPESTFLLGLHEGSLLAVSLWFGYISREFPLSGQAHVLAFNPILDHPDYVIVITASGAVYSWKMSDDTICQRFQMPEHLVDPPGVFQVSADGSYAILSSVQSDINILDVGQGRLCAVKANGQILFACLDVSGKYAVYISETIISHLGCSSKPCARVILTAIRVSNGRRVGRFYLCRHPCAVSISDNLSVYVSFEDGSIGVYAITDAEESATVTKTNLPITWQRHPSCKAQTWRSLEVPNITWTESLF